MTWQLELRGLAGAKVGAAVGGSWSLPGAAVGGFIGGVAGGVAASEAYDGTAADKIADKKCEDKLCAIKCKMGKVKSWFGGDHDQEGCLAKCHEEKQEEISEKESEIMAQVQIGKTTRTRNWKTAAVRNRIHRTRKLHLMGHSLVS